MRGGSRSTWSAPTACRETGTFDRYVVVDSGSAKAYLFDRDRVADGMRVVVGTPKTKTPMMAVLMRNAKANPYWNVPPELVRSLTAKRIGEQGLSYLRNFHYEVLSDWTRQRPGHRPQDGQLEGDRIGQARAADPRPPAAGAVEFDGRDEVRDAQRFRHLLARHAAQGAVREERPLAQQRLRAAGGLSALRHLGVRPPAAGDDRRGAECSSCRGRCRST